MAEQEYLQMNPGERVLFVAHRHWINVFPFFVSTSIIIIAGFLAIGYAANSHNNPASLLPFLDVAIVTPIVALIDVFSLLILFFAYVVYRQNRLVLTSQHLVQITQSGLFGRTLSKLSLDELQDVRGTRRGVFQTLLNYGEILIETAGAEENFFFRPVGDPLNIAEQINSTHEQYERRTTEEHDRSAYEQVQTAQQTPAQPPAAPSPAPAQPAPQPTDSDLAMPIPNANTNQPTPNQQNQFPNNFDSPAAKQNEFNKQQQGLGQDEVEHNLDSSK